jgi:hypothetical protein
MNSKNVIRREKDADITAIAEVTVTAFKTPEVNMTPRISLSRHYVPPGRSRYRLWQRWMAV